MARFAEYLTANTLMDEEPIILIADDTADDLFFLQIAFRRAEFKAQLRMVPDGEDAIAYLDGQSPFNDRASYPLPTLILLDLNMPGKNGFQVLEWVRAHPDFRYLPVLILTSS